MACDPRRQYTVVVNRGWPALTYRRGSPDRIRRRGVRINEPAVLTGIVRHDALDFSRAEVAQLRRRRHTLQNLSQSPKNLRFRTTHLRANEDAGAFKNQETR